MSIFSEKYHLMVLNSKKIIVAVLAAVTVCGCSVSRKADMNGLSSLPSPNVFVPDSTGAVDVNVEIRLPEKYMSTRSRLVLVPRVVKDTAVYTGLDPVAVDAPVYARKIERKVVLENYTDSLDGKILELARVRDTMSVPYRDTAMLGDMADQSRILFYVTVDGCGKCRALDTLDVGGITDPGALIDAEALKTVQLEPEFAVKPKIREWRGEAELMYRINSSEIDKDMGRNVEELARMLATLQIVLYDSLATLSSVKINGMASADGPLPFNTRLAKSRAGEAKNWLLRNLDGLTDRQVRSFTAGSRPEGWGPVLAAMKAAGDKDSVVVQEITDTYSDRNDDVQERFIRRLPCWKTIRENYLQSTRKVEYVYTYSIRSFATDDELVEMFTERPDAFNEEEMLRVSALQSDSRSKMSVYRTVLHYFPQSQTAANNLAVMLIDEGEYQAAQDVTDAFVEADCTLLNTKAVALARNGRYAESEALLTACPGLPEARYNLGLLKALSRNYLSAYILLRPFADVNSAIVSLCLGYIAEAGAIMETSGDMSPLAEYVRAIVAACNHDKAAFFTHLEAAVSDPVLWKRAGTDAFFDIFREDARFDIIMEENRSEDVY